MFVFCFFLFVFVISRPTFDSISCNYETKNAWLTLRPYVICFFSLGARRLVFLNDAKKYCSLLFFGRLKN